MGVKINSFKNLGVWKASHELMLLIYKLSSEFPRSEEYRITNQILRAVVSIPTNIAEGIGRFSKKEYVQFLIIARGSLEEVKYLVLLCRDLNYLSSEHNNDNIEVYTNNIGKMLNGLINRLRTSIPQSPTPNH